MKTIHFPNVNKFFSKGAEFFGKKILALGFLSVIVGAMIFIIELLMAYSIQYFLFALGIGDPQKVTNAIDLSIWELSLFEALLFFLVVISTRSILVWFQTYSASIISVEFETLSRKRLLNWSLSNRSAQVADVSSMFNEKIVGASNFISSCLGSVSRLLVMTLLLVALIKLSVEVTILSIAMLMLVFFPAKFITKKVRLASNSIHRELDFSIEKIIKGVKNILFLHIHGLYKKEIREVDIHLSEYLTQYKKYHFWVGMKHTFPQVLGIWLLCAVILISKDRELIADVVLVQFFYLFIRFIQNAGEVSNLASYLSLTRPRFLAVWDRWNEMRSWTDDWVEGGKDPKLFGGLIGWRFEGVSYAYQNGVDVISQLSMDIMPGEALIITGPSGSGKSTFLSLMLGLVKPTHGQIYIQTKSESFLIDEARPQLLNAVGYVGPENFVIAGSFRQNILYGCQRSCTDEELKSVINQSGCSYIFDFPLGIEHQLTEQGEGLSAGQKQRLGLARALLRKPTILILDEATANLDKKAEVALVDTLAELKSSMTIVAVTHREELLRIADRHLTLPTI
ncbi:ATP-binding cassette domain-containing protein [Polynucleobacter victoriensis]|uniref:ABC-type multidrug transport system, ATPase and permease component n=1 Tax=Polynucleobacter victoriensis TaxID=2049319 RepID=A0A212T7Z9_9BURK|nr:ABC transporter ATP-binding protein [Polynucleobacter victoriensis]SNC62162.1 ABC-type multidrug transport system, ATPase and permease component [Polynucleobacter victoriensis]